jgi:hypothetical protein
MGDRYSVDAQGHKTNVRHPSERAQPPSHGGSITAPNASGFVPGALPAGRYPGGVDHIHDLHAAHQIPLGPNDQYHGPLPPPAAPGTPSVLPPYLQHEASGKAPPLKDRKEVKDKKDKQEKDSKRKKTKGCC